MKLLLKILLSLLGLLFVAIFVFWLVLRGKQEWDDQTGHIAEAKIVEADKYTKVDNIQWAAPRGFSLTMDIYTPNTGKEKYPVIVMFHGGGWLINNETIMDSAAAYLASTGRYVVCNVNYRLLRDMGNTVKINEIVEDALGSVLWVKAHIGQYKGDPEQIAVTGDSAGGHLAAMVTLQGSDLSSKGFDDGPSGFRPTWLPTNTTPEQLAVDGALNVQAALLSYGAYNMYEAASSDSFFSGGFEGPANIFWYIGSAMPRGVFGDNINVKNNPDYYQKVSPYFNIPDTSQRKLPPVLQTVGELDPLVTPASVQEFAQKLKDKGHAPIEYWEYPGQSHAFLDSGSSFEENGIPALQVMVDFLDKVFY